MTSSRGMLPANGARPFVKWVGSKRQLLGVFESLYPELEAGQAYHEPFLGSGAVFFHLRSRHPGLRAFLSDGNAELIECWRAIREDVDGVIAALAKHVEQHGPEHYYKVRAARPRSAAALAARFIYLNKTGFNGLYRVNSKGEFNVPLGRHRNPAILQGELLREVSRALADVDLRVASYREVGTRAKPGDFIYFDPPYDPVSDTAYFTSYTRHDFGRDDQRALKELCCELVDGGCRVMLSNSATPFIKHLYRDSRFIVRQVFARRHVNSRADRRGPVAEVVVLSYSPPTRRRRRTAVSAGGSTARAAR